MPLPLTAPTHSLHLRDCKQRYRAAVWSGARRPFSPAQRRPAPTRRTLAAASGRGESDDQPVDIDALAARLGAEAERLRRLEGGRGSPAGDDDAAADDGTPAARRAPLGSGSGSSGGSRPADELLEPFGYESKAIEAEILASMGEGGFSSQEFELQQELGTISIQQTEAVALDLEAGTSGGSGLPASSSRATRPTVVAYSAVFYSDMPFQDPVLTLIKEYLPGAKAIACNELQVLAHLAGLPPPNRKWETASALLSPRPPIVPLLGYFVAQQSPRGEAMDADAADDALWVVLKWEGLAPLALYPSAQQTSGLGLGRLFGGQAGPLRDRWRMIRAIARGSLEALAFCHQRGVVHGAVGSGSLMLSTFDDQNHRRLVVKLDNFGFARKVSLPGPAAPSSRSADASSSGSSRGSSGGGPSPPSAALRDDTPLALGKRADLRALAIALLECLLSSLAKGGPSPLTAGDSVQRLLGDVFNYSLQDFEGYSRDEADWEAAVALLDDRGRAGWALLAALLAGTAEAGELAQHPFCQE